MSRKALDPDDTLLDADFASTRTVAQLRTIAKSMNISLAGITKKADMIKVLSTYPKQNKKVAPKKKTATAKKKVAKSKAKTAAKTKKPFAWIVVAYKEGESTPQVDIFAKREDAILSALWISSEGETGKSDEEIAEILVNGGSIENGMWTYSVESVSGLPYRKITNPHMIKIVKEALAKK